jgi:hypothetical protein
VSPLDILRAVLNPGLLPFAKVGGFELCDNLVCHFLIYVYLHGFDPFSWQPETPALGQGWGLIAGAEG